MQDQIYIFFRTKWSICQCQSIEPIVYRTEPSCHVYTRHGMILRGRALTVPVKWEYPRWLPAWSGNSLHRSLCRSVNRDFRRTVMVFGQAGQLRMRYVKYRITLMVTTAMLLTWTMPRYAYALGASQGSCNRIMWLFDKYLHAGVMVIDPLAQTRKVDNYHSF